jgi:hypothetical protein
VYLAVFVDGIIGSSPRGELAGVGGDAAIDRDDRHRMRHR